jgi:hypothetical protein
MSLLAEEIVEEWLNRQGYFTIRGVKLGVHEIDLLAIKSNKDGTADCRHIEVQASMRPMSFVSKVPKAAQKTGRKPNSVKRSGPELIEGVKEWVETKYMRKDKVALMASLWKGTWSTELVVNGVHSEDELRLIQDQGVRILRLPDILNSLANDTFVIKSACGVDLVELIEIRGLPQTGQS